MRALLIAPYYIHWHYSRAIQGIYSITLNFAWFFWHFFSIGLMLQTLFAPWQRLQESKSRGLDIENYFSTMAVNLVMRSVGIIIRTVFIAVGLLCIALTLVGGAVVFLIWLVLPGAIIFAFVFGFILLFRAS